MLCASLFVPMEGRVCLVVIIHVCNADFRHAGWPHKLYHLRNCCVLPLLHEAFHDMQQGETWATPFPLPMLVALSVHLSCTCSEVHLKRYPPTVRGSSFTYRLLRHTADIRQS